jgi:hypothetical protein
MQWHQASTSPYPQWSNSSISPSALNPFTLFPFEDDSWMQSPAIDTDTAVDWSQGGDTTTTHTRSQETLIQSPSSSMSPQSQPQQAPVEADMFDTPSYESISSLLSAYLTPAEAHLIASDFAQYIQQAVERVRDLRVSVCYSLAADEKSWPVVEWKEGDVEVLRLYHLEDNSCSWLTHYGVGKHWTPAGKDWLQAAVSWSVRNRRSLRSLFVASQHLKARLRLSSDIRNEEESSLFPECRMKSVSFHAPANFQFQGLYENSHHTCFRH